MASSKDRRDESTGAAEVATIAASERLAQGGVLLPGSRAATTEPVVTRKKKRVVQVAGNPEFAPPRPKPNKRVVNPLTGTEIFGWFPELTHPARPFPAGPIYLRHGEHLGRHHGFGLQHIWQEHFAAHDSAETALPHIAAFIGSVVCAGATIHYETGDRTTILQSAAGVVILQAMQDSANCDIYSVVTAFPARKANGPIIGAIS